MSERIKSQDLKNVLHENTKDHIVKSLQNQLDMCACAYYFTEILKDPSIYTYEDDYISKQLICLKVENSNLFLSNQR